MFFDFRTFNPLPIVFWQFWGHLRGWSLEEAGGKTAWTCELMGSRFQEPVQKRRSWKAYGFEIVFFWYFAEIPSHTLQSARWISTFLFAANVLKRAGHVQGQRWSRSTAGKSAVAGRGLQLTPGVQKVGVHHQFMTFFVWQSKWTRNPESYRPQTIRLNRTLVRADGG